MTIAVLLDSALLAVPSYVESDDQAEELIFRLKHWADLISRLKSRTICRSEVAEAVLDELNLYPSVQSLKHLLDLVDLSHVYDAPTVWKSYKVILTKCAMIADVVGIEITSLGDYKINPDILSQCFPVSLRSQSANAIATAVSANTLPGKGLVAVGSAVSGKATALELIATISGAIGADAGELGTFPVAVAGTAHLLSAVEDVVGTVASDLLWNDARDIGDIFFAVAVRSMEIMAAEGGPVELKAIPKFRIGSEFLNSLVLNDCGPRGTFGGVTLDCCARAVLRKPKEPLNPFSQKRRADQASALRSHVTKKGVGLRLMIWERPDGSYELANVGPKHELEIHEGGCEDAFGP